MEFKNLIDEHRSQIRFYQMLSFALVGVLTVLAVIVPSAIKTGPYVVQDSEGFHSVSRSQPWKLTRSRAEGFLKFYLSNRFELNGETFPKKKETLKLITSESAFQKLKDPVQALESLVKNQGAKAYYVLEGYRLSNQQSLIDAQVSRVIRLGITGVATPLNVRITYEDVAVSETNPYGMIAKAIEESEQGAQSQ